MLELLRSLVFVCLCAVKALLAESVFNSVYRGLNVCLYKLLFHRSECEINTCHCWCCPTDVVAWIAC